MSYATGPLATHACITHYALATRTLPDVVSRSAGTLTGLQLANALVFSGLIMCLDRYQYNLQQMDDDLECIAANQRKRLLGACAAVYVILFPSRNSKSKHSLPVYQFCLAEPQELTGDARSEG